MIYFKSYKGRGILPGQRVKVYRNLNMKPSDLGANVPNLPIYSVMDAASRLVLGHTQCILLSRATFEVSAKGRQKVLDTGRKNVHAFVVGHWTGQSWWVRDYDAHRSAVNVHRVSYNPRMAGHFFVSHPELPVKFSNLVSINHHGVYAHIEPKELSK